MYKFSGFLSIVFLLLACTVSAQTDNTLPDSNSYNGNVPDTTVLQSFVDTVTHIYNMDSLDKASKAREYNDYLKQSAKDAESAKLQIKKHIGALTMRNMHGRGYVKNGLDTAAIYVLKQFKQLKLKSVAKNGSFTQGFAFPVNTFPGKMKLFVNGDSLKPGSDFLIDPASNMLFREKLQVKKINLNEIPDVLTWKIVMSQFDAEHAYYFENTELFCSKILHVKRNVFLSLLPRGCYIIPQEGSLQWSVTRDTITATVFYVHPDALPKNFKTVSVGVTSLYIPHFRNVNIVGSVPGMVKDSFIVFSAHYDHLGMMGDTTIFPGASDDAGGIAMLLSLAAFYAKHPSHYSILFIAFAGEEAALMGSEFFVKNPMAPLKNIKFMVNMDIMGDASNGITVVNATEFPTEFGLLKQINDREKFLTDVHSRGPAANSDHYYFAKAGVPAFLIYSNGGKGYYHDIFDKAKDVSANKLDGVERLLISFTKEL